MTTFTSSHAAMRAAERCGVLLSAADLCEIAGMIGAGKSALLRHEPLSLTAGL